MPPQIPESTSPPLIEQARQSSETGHLEHTNRAGDWTPPGSGNHQTVGNPRQAALDRHFAAITVRN